MHTVLLKIVLQRDASKQSSMHSAMLFSPMLIIMISIIVRDCTDVTDVRKSRKKIQPEHMDMQYLARGHVLRDYNSSL